MITPGEFILSFQQGAWICKQDAFRCYTESLDELDEILLQKFKQAGYKGKIEIKYLFDFDAFPVWMRQYMPHYFNRKITLTI